MPNQGNNDTGAGVLAFDTLTSRLHFQGQLVCLTGLRIGAGRDTDVIGHDLPVMRDAIGRPFIPGASFKGVLRSLIESLLRGLSPEHAKKLACEVLSNESRCIPASQMQEWREKQDPNELSRLVYENSCLVCQTFGSTWLASHIAVRDLLVEPSLWFGQFEVRQGVAIERDTETASDGHLYSFGTIPVGTRFNIAIEGDNLADWQKGLLYFGLQPFIRGEMMIGGARSRGLGHVELVEGEWRNWDIGEGNDKTQSVIQLLSEGMPHLEEEQKKQYEEQWKEALTTKLTDTLKGEANA